MLWRPYERITLEFDQRPEEVLTRLSDLVEPGSLARAAFSLSDFLNRFRTGVGMGFPRTREFTGSITGNKFKFKLSPINESQRIGGILSEVWAFGRRLPDNPICQINGVIEECPRGARLRMSVRHPFVSTFVSMLLLFPVCTVVAVLWFWACYTTRDVGDVLTVAHLLYRGYARLWKGLLLPLGIFLAFMYVGFSHQIGVEVDKAKRILTDRLHPLSGPDGTRYQGPR